ncbi:MAG: DUF3467 domain-containing protein [Candidatus Angelobacter sp.]
MAEEEKQQPQHDNPPSERAWRIAEEGRPEIYSNIYYLHWSLVDVRIRFGQMVPDSSKSPESSGWYVQEMAAVTVAWAQAKAMAEQLADIVKKYEAVNGEIKPLIMPQP